MYQLIYYLHLKEYYFHDDNYAYIPYIIKFNFSICTNIMILHWIFSFNLQVFQYLSTLTNKKQNGSFKELFSI